MQKLNSEPYFCCRVLDQNFLVHFLFIEFLRYRELNPGFCREMNRDTDGKRDICLFGDSDFSHWLGIEEQWEECVLFGF